jgi:predicted AAA+ superfamily ATPase
MKNSFIRPLYNHLKSHIQEALPFIHIIIGPRQVGKTTLVRQVAENLGFSHIYASADSPIALDHQWIVQHWEKARFDSKQTGSPILLVFDEIQKITNWGEVVKKCWDEDRYTQTDVRVVITGSSALMLKKGTESLAGRYEKTLLLHWSFAECQACFNISLNQYILLGGYPGAYAFLNEPERWKGYIRDSLIEPVIGKDILLSNPIQKPALFRQFFNLTCVYASQVVSYQKLVGQLQDAGNTTTLSHYQQLLEDSWLLTGLQKFQNNVLSQRTSSPKWIPLNIALVTALSSESFDTITQNPALWGRWVESTIGMHLVTLSYYGHIQIFYWKQGDLEVDFVIKTPKKIIGIEVKSSKTRTQKGIQAFLKTFPEASTLLVGEEGISIEDFLKTTPSFWEGY